MKKIICATFVFALLNTHAQTQTPSCALQYLHNTEEKPMRKGVVIKNNDDDMIFAYELLQGIAVMRVSKDSETEPLKHKPEYNGKAVVLVGGFRLGSKTVIIGQSYKMKPLTNYVLAYVLDEKSLQLSEPTLLFEEPYTAVAPNEHAIRVENKTAQPSFSLITTKGVWSRDSRKMRITGFDEDFSKKFDKTFDFETLERKPVIEHVAIRNGNIALAAREYDTWTRKEEKHGDPNYSYHIFYAADGSTNIQDHKIETKDVFINSILPGIISDGNVVAVGLYSKTDKHNLAGIFYQRIGKGGVEKTSMKEFDNDMVKLMVDKRKQSQLKEKKGDLDAIPYDLDHLFFSDNGDCYMVAENYYVTVINNTAKYHYQDLLVTHVNNTGDVDWVTKVDKKSKTEGPSKTYDVLMHNEKLVIFFNDNKANINDADDERVDVNTKRMNAVPVMVAVDKNGKQSKQAILLDKETHYIVPASLINTGNNHYIRAKRDGGIAYYKILLD